MSSKRLVFARAASYVEQTLGTQSSTECAQNRARRGSPAKHVGCGVSRRSKEDCALYSMSGQRLGAPCPSQGLCRHECNELRVTAMFCLAACAKPHPQPPEFIQLLSSSIKFPPSSFNFTFNILLSISSSILLPVTYLHHDCRLQS